MYLYMTDLPAFLLLALGNSNFITAFVIFNITYYYILVIKSTIKMEPELSIENLLTERCDILDQHQLETAFLKSKENLKEVLTFLREFVFDISNKLAILRQYLNELHENNESYRKLSSLYQELNEKILQMYANIPEELITAYANTNKNKLIESNASIVSHHNISSEIHQNVEFNNALNVQEPIITDCKKELFSEPTYPRISLLSEEEYNKIPKYMIGRQTLDKVNNLVISINKVLTAKYSLLFAGKQAAKKKGQLDMYLHYKKQDVICENCGCRYFFTTEDYESSTKTKLDRAALNMMMALRHCKRIREYRLKKELYYVILD